MYLKQAWRKYYENTMSSPILINHHVSESTHLSQIPIINHMTSRIWITSVDVHNAGARVSIAANNHNTVHWTYRGGHGVIDLYQWLKSYFTKYLSKINFWPIFCFGAKMSLPCIFHRLSEREQRYKRPASKDILFWSQQSESRAKQQLGGLQP